MSYIPQQRVNLTEARRLRVWSQKELAEQLGTTQVNVSRWERGLTTPTPYFRSKLMALLRKSDLELGLRPNELTENRIYQLPSCSYFSPHQQAAAKQPCLASGFSTMDIPLHGYHSTPWTMTPSVSGGMLRAQYKKRIQLCVKKL